MKKITFYKLGIESKLWHAFKVKCATLSITMLSAIQNMIKKFVEEKQTFAIYQNQLDRFGGLFFCLSTFSPSHNL